MNKIRGMVLALGVLLLISMVSAQDHICQAGNASIHGVFINGDCYNCGEDEGGEGLSGLPGVCPIDYGAKLCTVRDPDCVYEFNTYWSLNSEGLPEYGGDVLKVDLLSGRTNLYIVSTETELSPGEKVTFTIYRDALFDEEIYSVEGDVLDTVDTRAVAVFSIDEQSDYLAKIEEGGEFFARASISDGWPADGFDNIDTPNLKINVTRGGKMVLTCADYTEDGETVCEEDSYGVGKRIVTRQDALFPGCTYTSSGSCYWNETACIQKQGPETITEGSEEACEEGRISIECGYPTEEKYGSCEIGDEFYRVKYISNLPNDCPAFETQPVACPKTLRLPFFGIYGIVASLSMIGFIYFLFGKKFNL